MDEFAATYEMPAPYAHARKVMRAALQGGTIVKSKPCYTKGKGMQLVWEPVNVFDLDVPVSLLNNPAYFEVRS